MLTPRAACHLAAPPPPTHTPPPLQLLIEQSFAWDSKMEVKLLVTLLGQAQQVAKAQGSTGSGGAWAALQALLSRASRVRVGRAGALA